MTENSTENSTAAFRTRLESTLARNAHMVRQLVSGVPEEAGRTPLFEGGSHMNWLVGHLTGNRDSLLRLLGGEAVRSTEENAASGYGSSASVEPSFSLEEQLAAYSEAGKRLKSALEGLTAEQLAAPATTPAGEGTVAEALDFLTWHETYHVGQLMLYRRAAGLDSPIG